LLERENVQLARRDALEVLKAAREHLGELAVLCHLAVERAVLHLERVGHLLELAAAVLCLELGRARLSWDELRERDK
jgi:hypothetical protein